MMSRIGFMQGRFSPLVDGRIQAFPWSCWQQEFTLAKAHNFCLMEWTLDQDGLFKNPLMSSEGQTEIKSLSNQSGLQVCSLTGDCFMQRPFWKLSGPESAALLKDFSAVIVASAVIGIKMVVVPLVDNGRLENRMQEDYLVEVLHDVAPELRKHGVQVLFESDFVPAELARFIGRLDADIFGVNYDIGNSASLGINPVEELAAYGERIKNVHIKDRVFGGTSVPLGKGNADFPAVFAGLAKIAYSGNYILQTARANDEQHAEILSRYRDMTIEWMKAYAA